MKIGLSALIALCLSAVFTQGAFGQVSERESFDRKLYTVVSLPHFKTSPQQFAGLSADQKRNLLACRDVLISFFQRADSKADITRYLAPDQAKKYRTLADLVEPETSLMEIGILDWDFEGDGNQIHLRFFTVAFSEGNWVLSNNAATLKMIGSEWRVAKLDLNTK